MKKPRYCSWRQCRSCHLIEHSSEDHCQQHAKPVKMDEITPNEWARVVMLSLDNYVADQFIINLTLNTFVAWVLRLEQITDREWDKNDLLFCYRGIQDKSQQALQGIKIYHPWIVQYTHTKWSLPAALYALGNNLKENEDINSFMTFYQEYHTHLEGIDVDLCRSLKLFFYLKKINPLICFPNQSEI